VKLEFFPAAEQELLEASEHYEAQLQGLGNDFVLEVERLSAVLIELPSLGEKLDSMHRRLPLRRFPYALIFRRDADVIRVVAVAHRRRKPRYWAPRVQER
jgi:plasmid stabilization system protein ParE